MRTRWLIATILASGVLVAGVAACGDSGGSSSGSTAATSGSTEAAGQPESGGVVIVGQDQAPETLNNTLLAGNTVVTNQATFPVNGENLLMFTPDYKYVAQLAESVPNAADGTLQTNPFRVTFTIKEGVTWSDGTPFTADDIIFQWKTIMDPKNKVTGRTGWEQVSRIDKKDDRTFTVVFKQPYAPWRDMFSPSGGSTSRILPEHILKGKDFNTAWTRTVVGTGPYVVDEYTPDERLVLVPNPKYWNRQAGGPYVDRIVNVFLKETTTQDVQFRSGEVNFINPPTFSIIPELQALPDTTVEDPPGVTWEHLQINSQDPLMKDKNIRLALAYAVDPTQLIEVSTKNTVKPLFSFLVPEQAPYYEAAWEDVTPNADKVSEYLTAAGYTKNADGFWEKDGEVLTIEFATIAGNEVRKLNFQLMKKQLEALGIKMVPRFYENFFDADGPLITGKYQVAELAYSASADPTVTSIFASDEIPSQANGFAGQNTFRISNPQLDTLMTRSDEQVDEAERAATMKQIQQLVRDEMYLIPLYQRPEVVAYADNLNNVQVNPTQVSHFADTQTWFYTGGKASR